MMNDRKSFAATLLGAAALALAVAATGPALAADPFDKLVAAAKAEMDKKQGKVSMNLDWPDEDTKDVFPAFMKPERSVCRPIHLSIAACDSWPQAFTSPW